MKSKLMIDRRLIWLARGILALTLFGVMPPSAVRAAGTYYVSTTGSDVNPGSLAAPFRTIQRCADVAAAGDTCAIRAGTYRETVTVPRSGTNGSPITFAAYNGETVLISGADVLTGWSLHAGQIFKTSMPWDLNVRQGFPNAQVSNNQVFVDGQMAVEARWPNIPLDAVTELSNVHNARADAASVINTYTATYVDAGLASFATDAWAGAKINFVPGWRTVSASCDVTGSTASTVSFTCNPDPGADNTRFDWPDTSSGVVFRPSSGNPYYLWGKLEALDAAGEWFRAGDGTLYLWAPTGGSPAAHVVEARRRLFAFDLRNRDFVTIKGVQLFAAAFATDNSTDNLTVDGVRAQYLWHAQQIPSRWSTTGMYGLFLSGNDNVVRDSEFRYSAGPILSLSGRRNRVENTVIANGDYLANAPVVMASFPDSTAGANRNVFEQNTVFNGGNRLIAAGSGLDILRNDVYNSHLQISDLGTIYEYNTDGLGANIAYNLVHDNWAELNADLSYFGGFGIYLDDNTRNYNVFRNVVWNTTSDGLFAYGTDPGLYPDSNRLFINNTVAGRVGARLKPSGQTLGGTEFRNTYAAGALFEDPGVTLQNNRVEGLVVSAAPDDFSLRPDSPAIDVGAVLPGFTDGYIGAAPDVGAYEFGQTPFVAGALLRAQDLAMLSAQCAAGTDATATCTLTGLPIGRKLPVDFQIRIGATGTPAACTTRMDYATHTGIGLCPAISTTGASGLVAVYVRSGGAVAWIDTGEVVDLRPLAITAVVPASGPDLGGVSVQISGRRFQSGYAGYQRTITIDNATGAPLSQYQVLVVFDTASLVAAGKLRADCGDLRFVDAYGELPYWIEQGCGTATTRLWVKVPLLPAGASTILGRYGAPHATPGSNGRATFVFFDDFADGILDTAHWSATTGGWYTFTETGGVMRLTGAATGATQYDRAYLYLKETGLLLPADFAIDSRVTQTEAPVGFKASLGSNALNLFGGALPKALGYWNGSAWVPVGTSTVNAVTFVDRVFSLSYFGPDGSRTVRWAENGDLATVRASRNGLNNPEIGTFDFGPDSVSSFDVRWDDVRVRVYAYPEPTTTLGGESQVGVRVSVGGQPCTDVVVIDAATLTCYTAAHAAGFVDVVVTNPDQQATMLAGAFSYFDAQPVYLPIIRR